MGKGQELYKKAKTMIPGGTMLLSKRPEQHLPEHWPAYFSKSKGCKVWDLDGREYIDCSMMGIGTNTLGYCNEAVDAAVMEVVKNGNMTTLNCPEEVELAERLIELNKPWAGGVRFSRAGGEANAISIRIARAFTGKDKVAVCGYHGWHDWYLSVNLGEDDALAGYLLTGLDPAGVPRGLHNSTLPFHYNKFEELLEIVNHNDLAAIKMEVSRNMEPNDDFLNKVRKLATERGIVLIFDETITIRAYKGGLQSWYGVKPDLTISGKTLGGGIPLGVVGGSNEVMDVVTKDIVQMSGTHHGHRLACAAGIAILKQLDDVAYKRLNSMGERIKNELNIWAKEKKIPFIVFGESSVLGYAFTREIGQTIRTHRDYWLKSDAQKMQTFALEIAVRGFLPVHRGQLGLTLPMADQDITDFIETTKDIVSEMYA